MISNSYCEKAFTHINAHANGHYRLCCYARVHPELAKYKTQTTPPFEYFLSPEMESIRSDMQSGKRIPGCEFCYEIEDDGLISPRLEINNNRHFTKVEDHSVSVQVRIFGNACNLSCYMCFPYNSTTRNKEIKTLDTDIFTTVESDFYQREIEVSTQDVLDNIDLIDFITIIGGEPFVMRPHWEFLDSIPDSKKSKIEIRYQTNLYKLHHMKWDIRDYFGKFKKITLFVSADHYGDRLEWIRYPIDADEFENNLMEFQKHIQEIHLCVSILNAHDTKRIINYYEKNFNIPVILKNVVKDPHSLSIRQMSDADKQSMREILIDLGDRVPELAFHELDKPRVESDYNKFVDYIKQLDEKRGTDANKIFGCRIYE